MGFRKGLTVIRGKVQIIVVSLKYFLFGFDEVLSALRNLNKATQLKILRKYGAIIGDNCDIETPLYFHNAQSFRNLRVGNNVHIGRECFFDLREKIEIKDNAVISMRCTFITHQDLNKSELSKKYPAESAPVLIGRNVYIGACATILHGVQVGENSVIGASALVIKNIDSDITAVGIPAKALGK